MTYAIVFAVLLCLAFLIRFNFFRKPVKGVLVLLYHRIDNKPTGTSLDKFSISSDTFEKQIRLLKRMGFISISPNEIEKIGEQELWKRNRYALITFDDGYKDNLKAAQILQDHSMKGLFFISTAYIGKQMNGVDMLDKNDIKSIVSYGMYIGSHSHNHYKLAEMERQDVKREAELSVNILSEFSNIYDFAYPFGNYNNSIIDILKQLGIKRAYIIGQKIYQIHKYSYYKIPRAIIRHNTNLLDFYLIATRGRSTF